MKVYEFRLATVERIRLLEEKLAREKLVASLRDLRQAQAANESAHKALRAMASLSGIVSMADIQWLDDQRERLAESLRICTEKVALAQSMSLDARASWGAASKRAGVLERLDEHGLASWREAALRGEVAESDDLANARFRAAGGGE
ncbi:MAG: flagellar export protein FliJ [Acidimicrobiales bacterium]